MDLQECAIRASSNPHSHSRWRPSLVSSSTRIYSPWRPHTSSHLVSNHPFVDGNKRIGLLAALVFLDLNGVSIVTSSDALYALTMEVAQGQAGKELVASRLRQLSGGD